MSSLKLWEIPQAIENVEEFLVDVETGEILSQEEANVLIEQLEIEKDKKTEWIAKEILNLKAEAEALKTQKKAFEQRQKAAEKKAESLKNYLQFALSGEKWKAVDSSVAISYRTTKNCLKVSDLEKISEEWFKTPHTEINLNKTALKECLMNGGRIDGVELEDRISVIVK